MITKIGSKRKQPQMITAAAAAALASAALLSTSLVDKPNLVMHIGPSKTGTSTLQKHKRNN